MYSTNSAYTEYVDTNIVNLKIYNKKFEKCFEYYGTNFCF